MQTYIFYPSAPLAEFIELIWVSEAKCFDYSNIVLPMLHHEWLISFSDRFDISGADHHSGSWVRGIQTKPVQTQTSGGHFTVGVLFKPDGLSAFTKCDLWELKDVSVESSFILGKQSGELTEQIFMQRDAKAICRSIEIFLLQRMDCARSPRIAYVMQRLEKALPEDGLINRIAKETGLSGKTLIHSFKQYVGLTPAKYHHLVTLQKVLSVLASEGSLTSAAYDLQFSDQSHFNHFFKTYSGITPSAYRNKMRAGKVSAHSLHSIEN